MIAITNSYSPTRFFQKVQVYYTILYYVILQCNILQYTRLQYSILYYVIIHQVFPESATHSTHDLALFSGRNRFGSIRFGCGLLNYSSFRFNSVRNMIFPGSTRFGLRFSDASWLGPVRFGSFPRSVPAVFRITRFGSVRLGRFGSVSYSFLYNYWKLLDSLNRIWSQLQRLQSAGPSEPYAYHNNTCIYIYIYIYT